MNKSENNRIIDVVFPELDSTQTHAKQEYENKYKHLNEWVAIRAEKQTAGRGQHDRKWDSAIASKNILVTFIIPNFTNFQCLHNIPLLTGYSVVQTIKQLCNIDGQIKWVNDVYINDKKTCGILTETELMGDKLVIFLGVGININYCPEYATCLEHATKCEIDQIAFYEQFKINLQINIINLAQDGFTQFKVSIEKILYKLGQQCNFIDPKTQQQVTSGKIEGIDNNGQLVIRSEDGLLQVVQQDLRMVV